MEHHIAFFGHDAADGAVRRRVRAMQNDGLQVTGFMMRRRENISPEWNNIDLGLTRDRAVLARLKSIFVGARVAARSDELEHADVIYARNLDMLIAAFLAKRLRNLPTPVIYECLDINRLMIRQDIVGKILRWIEGRLLKRSKALVTSSPGFLKHYFEVHHAGKYTAYLVENRLAAGFDYGARPSAPKQGRPDKLRLGWVGMLRCQRSLDLMCDLADRFPEQLEIRLHGIPGRTEIAEFEPVIEPRANIIFAGRYKSPEDLAEIYANIDVVWAGDFMDAGYNSVWLLPNRIYEGGYYGVPAIAPKETETGNWIADRSLGFTLDEPLEDTLPSLITEFLDSRASITAANRNSLAQTTDTFVEPPGLIKSIILKALGRN
ncbi:MAG: glycosyl transferase [Pseudomonadota bacterium]